MSFSCELQQMRGHVFNFFRRGKFTKQNPVPQDVQHSLIDLLKLGFVHTGERYGFRPAPAAAIRIKMLGIKPGLDGYPFPEGIKRFKKGDVPGSQARKQIELVRAQSKAGNNGPWVTHWEEMAKKTAIRRLFKYLPVSIEIQRAVSMDEKETLTIDPADASVITGEYSVVENAGVEENVTA